MDHHAAKHLEHIDPKDLAGLTNDWPFRGETCAPLPSSSSSSAGHMMRANGYLGAFPNSSPVPSVRAPLRAAAYPPPPSSSAPLSHLVPSDHLAGDWSDLDAAALATLGRDYERTSTPCFADSTDARALRLGRASSGRFAATGDSSRRSGALPPRSATAARRRISPLVSGMPRSGDILANPITDNQSAFQRQVRYNRTSSYAIPRTYGRSSRVLSSQARSSAS